MSPSSPARTHRTLDDVHHDPIRTIGRVLAGIVDPQAAATRLVELALAGEARDNVTAVVIDVAPNPTTYR